MRILVDDNDIPHLCLFAKSIISPGDEILYSYGTEELPWHQQVWQFMLC